MAKGYYRWLKLVSKYGQHSDAPSATTRSWKPGSDAPVKKPITTINHVEGNKLPDDSATKMFDNSKSNSATKKIDNSPSNSATKNKDVSNADEGKQSSDVRSPTSTEVRSPTSTEVRSPTSTEVRSPTSTSTEAYTADNFTATVTGGAGAGATTTVNIYPAVKATPVKDEYQASNKIKELTKISRYDILAQRVELFEIASQLFTKS